MADTLARPPVAFERVLAKRALLSALGPLAGLRAEGNVTATAIGAPVVLPAFSYGIPIIGGKALTDRMVKVLPVLDDNGHILLDENDKPVGHTITSGGTAVPVRAAQGGPSGNLPEGTPIIWQPLPSGLALRGAVAAGGIAGGIAQDGPGRCKRVVAFETLGADPAKAFWEAPGEGLPAIIIARTGSTPIDSASTVASTLRQHTFQIYVSCSTLAGNDERAEEGELLLDAIESTLDGLEDVEGEVFSGPPCELGSDQRERPRSPNLHVWSIEARLFYALKRVDVRLSDGVSWQPWATTLIEVAAPATETQDAHVVVSVTADETP